MLYDLNIAWSPGTSTAELERTLKFAKYLGYDVVALNHIISAPIPTQPTPITNPIPQLTPPHPSYPGGACRTTTTTRTTSSSTTTTTNLSTTAPSALPPTSKGAGSSLSSSSTSSSLLPTTLRRATLVITDPSTINYRLSDYARAYDLLALRPTSDKSFSWACLSTSEAPALVSLDLASHLGWHVHHRTAMAAVQRGVRFEICYAQALGGGGGNGNGSAGGPEAARRRANFIGNVQALLRATKGRGIVLSSEARGALGLRGPADVVNLLAVWGLGPEKGFAALGEGARAVVVNEGIRRRGFRGVVDIVKTAEGGDVGGRGDGEEEGDGEGVKATKKNNKQQQQQQQQQGQKRKNGDGGQQGGLSKKQAKKMRKEAAQANA
ncbi:RNase P subunit p30-domain-containing protein [Chaetomium strumarium]|uniref:RNase P subunit p30-domain-containing protein n=1 Tax=Chaetomium strumarium TaxID=1170767 RepID=A0AAJ0M5J2_9PEZI|nr:RNase P subunit p30-domain-containing protein [Chaetomium strumarium]